MGWPPDILMPHCAEVRYLVPPIYTYKHQNSPQEVISLGCPVRMYLLQSICTNDTNTWTPCYTSCWFPTHLKSMLVKLGGFPQVVRVENKKHIWVATTQYTTFLSSFVVFTLQNKMGPFLLHSLDPRGNERMDPSRVRDVSFEARPPPKSMKIGPRFSENLTFWNGLKPRNM